MRCDGRVAMEPAGGGVGVGVGGDSGDDVQDGTRPWRRGLLGAVLGAGCWVLLRRELRMSAASTTHNHDCGTAGAQWGASGLRIKRARL
jgi:hypothetical protein